MELKDITGQKFGTLTVLEYTDKKNKKGERRLWRCRCKCGSEILTTSGPLLSGKRKSCGCNNPKKFQDLVGKRFGKLIVIKFDHKEGKGSGVIRYFWKCKCDCGNETIVRRGHLKDGKIRSCGCLSNRQGKDSPHFKGYEEITGGYYGSLKTGANYKGRHFRFNVSLKYLWELFLKQNRKCALTGWPLMFDKRRGSKQTASLDRIDNSKGYIEENVQWVHKDINILKSNYDENHFIKLCDAVANYKKCGIITPV
jgi:hypothetical protein